MKKNIYLIILITALPQMLLSQGMTNDGGWQYYHGVSSGNGLLIGTINGNTNVASDRAHILYRNTDGGKYFGYNGTGTQTTLINSQNNGDSYFNSGGNLGIGTTSPSARLHIEKSSGALLRLSNDANNFLYSGIDPLGAYIEQVSNSGSKSKIRLQARNSNQGTYSQFYINGENNTFNLLNGKTGIGTSSPNGLLEIVGPYDGNSQLIINTTNSNGELRFSDNGTTKGYVWYLKGSDMMAFGRGGTATSMFVNSTGQFGIGTTSTGSHKLAVEGSIGAREIKVEASGWSDFVFEKDYELRTLEEVEEHINENGHLPEIPSEAEVSDNGINLGEMDAKLLQKIEELTLYMIDMNKQLKSQYRRVEQLEQENSELKEKVNRLENE